MLRTLTIVLFFALGGAGSARADIWSYTDKGGVVHFTNRKPTGPGARKWRRVLREGPSRRSPRARSSSRARVSSSAGLPERRPGRCDRCDRVPARDRSPERFHRYDPFIYEAAALYQIPVPLIRAVIKVESDYDPRVVSAFGARGLMQLMPSVIGDMGVRDAHDPRENILGGTRLLRVLANRYRGDLVRTIAAYHAGMGSLSRYGDDVPPYEHTRKYLRMVLDRYHRYRAEESAH